MDRQEISRTAKIIRTLMQQKQYHEVIRIAEGIDLSEINNRLMILDVTKAYEQLQDKNSAKETLLNYYRSYGFTGRNMIQKLVELCFETRDVENGVHLCHKFVNEWPESSLFYLMSYYISAYEDQNIETQIMYLEKYTSMEFKERLVYELARLYANNRQDEKCTVLCHELICLYGHGVYIEKAADLKERICGLSADEIRVLESAKERNQEAKEEESEEETLKEPDKETDVSNDENAEAERKDVLILEETEEISAAVQEEVPEAETVQEEMTEDKVVQEEVSEEETVQEEVSEEETVQEEVPEAESTQEEESAEEQPEMAQDEKERLSEEERLRQISEEKVRQTEAAARARMEQEEKLRKERESKLNEAINGEDRYGQVERIGSDQIFYPDMVKKTAPVQKKKNRRGFFDRFADNIRDTLQVDSAENDGEVETDELEYMVMGINPEAYTDEVERRMIRELELLDREEIEQLTPAQIKEIYELKILHDVKEIIGRMILESKSMPEENLDAFIETDPYKNEVLERIREEDEKEQKRQEECAEPEEENGLEAEEEENIPTISQTAAETAAKVIENAKALVKEVKDAAGLSGESLEDAEEDETQTESIADETESGLDELANNSVNVEKKPAVETAAAAERNAKAANEAQKGKTEVKKLKKKTRAVLASIKNPDEGMGIKEFIDCVVACADEMGYEVEKDAHITLAALAEEMLSERIALSLNHARRVTEHAINKQKNRSALDKFMDRYGKKRANVLRDKHFNLRVKKYE